MPTLPTINPNAAMQTQGLNTPTASNPAGTSASAPIAGSPLTPAQQIAQQAQNQATENAQQPGSNLPTIGAPVLNSQTGVQNTVQGATSNVQNNTSTAFGATNTNPGENMSLADKYALAHQTAQASGQEAPSSTGAGAAGVQSNLPQTSADAQAQADAQAKTSAITTQLQNDPGYQQIVTAQQQYMNTENQQQSLEQQYTDLTNQAGIPALDSQLISMQSVINGTDQDIRNEVTAAGGFATESQVQALSAARNKVLIQNYNNLLQTKTDLENTINTTMGFAKDDQANAQSLAQEQLNYNTQLATYTQKFTQNAQDALTSMQKTEGWDGIYAAALASGDPTAIERINQTMGQGFDLATMAKQDALAKQQAQQTANLTAAKTQADIANTKATTANTQATTAKTIADTNAANGVPNPAKANAPGYDANGVKYTVSTAAQELTNEIKNQGLTGTAHLLTPGNYNQMEAWWVSQGLTPADFKAEFGGYIDPTRTKEYN